MTHQELKKQFAAKKYFETYEATDYGVDEKGRPTTTLIVHTGFFFSKNEALVGSYEYSAPYPAKAPDVTEISNFIVYFNFIPKGDLPELIKDSPFLEIQKQEDDVLIGKVEATDPAIGFALLEEMRNAGKFLTKWKRNPTMYLINSMTLSKLLEGKQTNEAKYERLVNTNAAKRHEIEGLGFKGFPEEAHPGIGTHNAF